MSTRGDFRWIPVLLALAIPAASVAQRGPPRAAGARLFDPATVQTVEGEVAEVTTIPHGRRYEGVHLTLSTAQGMLDVHLGPKWYVDREVPKIAKGERVEVKGSRVVVDGKPALIAQEIRKGDAQAVLRDGAGVPAWSRPRRR